MKEKIFWINIRSWGKDVATRSSGNLKSRYIKVKVEHYLLFMFSLPKIRSVVSGIKYICLHLLPVFFLIQLSSKQIICFDFRKQNSVLPIVFYSILKSSPLICFCHYLTLAVSVLVFKNNFTKNQMTWFDLN